MKKYQSDATSYNAIVEAMQQIRQNALAENYSEDEMEEAYMYEEDDEEDMAEMSGDEEEAVAEMMDEALHEMEMEDDEDNLNEADDGSRKARRRKRMRQALLIGAGLAAAGGLGAAYTAGRGARQPGPDVITGNKSGFAGVVQDTLRGANIGMKRGGEAATNFANDMYDVTGRKVADRFAPNRPDRFFDKRNR
jgi:hypothetical protein